MKWSRMRIGMTEEGAQIANHMESQITPTTRTTGLPCNPSTPHPMRPPVRHWLRRLVRLWSDFQYVRHNSNRPLEGVTVHENGSASFRMMPSTLRFGECFSRLPKWLRKLAAMTAKKPNVSDQIREE